MVYSIGASEWSKKLYNTSSQDKPLTLVPSVYALFLHLMLDLDDSLLQGSFFEDFMNNFDLLTNNVAQSKTNM